MYSIILTNWYSKHKRELPWRNTQNPYYIWISEIILQQTRVAQGLPYFISFINQFPDLFSLANASDEQVLRLWQGLGYYSRARNMHKTAKNIVENYLGEFPNSYENLIKLKGIGPYTAAAIASFAYNEKVAVLDGNVIRVLSRIFCFEDDVSMQKNKYILQIMANQILPYSNYNIHNQAIMEFGALQCTPKNPNCEICPLQIVCGAFKNNKVNILPFKKKSKPSINRYFTYYIYKSGTEIAMKKRIAGDIWEGLYDFYHSEDKNIQTELLQNGKVIYESNLIKHILSHQNLWIKFIVIIVDKLETKFVNENKLVFLCQNEINKVGLPIVVDKFLKTHNALIFNNYVSK